MLGRGSEEAQACRAAGVPFEVVPAVTSAIAAPAYAGIPVTHRAVAPAFAVVTGHEDPTKDATQVDWAALARFPGTLVLLMAVGRIGDIAAALVAAGKDPATPVAMVRWGTTPRQETLAATLADVGEQVARTGFGSPAVTVVGQVAALRDELAWFDRRPLSGVSVLVPRTRHQAGELSARLRALGADPVEAATIAVEPPRAPDDLRARLRAMAGGAHDWVAFTSANAVEAASGALADLGLDARAYARVRIAAVGPGTAEALAAAGLTPDLVPARATTRDLAAALLAAAGPGQAPGCCSRAPTSPPPPSPTRWPRPGGTPTRSRPTAPCRSTTCLRTSAAGWSAARSTSSPWRRRRRPATSSACSAAPAPGGPDRLDRPGHVGDLP